jgi:monoamine oxidase
LSGDNLTHIHAIQPVKTARHADVVIVGAGAAGLAAARHLTDAGVDACVIEARDRIGGRVFTTRDPDTSIAIELGAEFVHGRATDLLPLIQEASLTMVDIGGTRWRPRGTTLRRFDDFWEQLDAVMRRLDSDRRRRDRSFHDALLTNPGGRRLAEARQLARQYVEGFHAADPSLVSAQALAENGSPGDDARERRIGRVLEGYDRVLAWLAAPLEPRIRLSSVVTEIEWEPRRVSVHVTASPPGAGTTRRSHGGRRSQIHSRAVIVTVPVGVLGADPSDRGAIRFAPAIDQKRTALERIASGTVVRIVLRLRERFWTEEAFTKRHGADDLDTWSFLHGRDDPFPTWWTAYPSIAPVVVGWCGGPCARDLVRESPEAITDTAVTALARQVGLPRRAVASMVERTWMHDWEHDPYSRGAYSYQLVGGIDAPAELAKPIRGTLFFAGEASEGSGGTGTVDGAMATGKRAARQVLRALG